MVRGILWELHNTTAPQNRFLLFPDHSTWACNHSTNRH